MRRLAKKALKNEKKEIPIHELVRQDIIFLLNKRKIEAENSAKKQLTAWFHPKHQYTSIFIRTICPLCKLPWTGLRLVIIILETRYDYSQLYLFLKWSGSWQYCGPFSSWLLGKRRRKVLTRSCKSLRARSEMWSRVSAIRSIKDVLSSSSRFQP